MLVTTLTKKMSEDLTDYLLEAGVRARYLHSEIDTLERIQIIRELRLGEYDVLVGINLLREGLDLPEVSLVAILDADKEGFLRGKTALVQTIGRAARNVNGRVLLYADKMTEAIKGAMEETERRRAIQLAYNEEHGTTPISIMKGVSDIAEFLSLENPNVPGRRRRGAKADVEGLSREELEKLAVTLEEEMFVAAEELRFEYAAKLRDEIKDLRRELPRSRSRQLGGRHVPEHQVLHNFEPAATPEEVEAAALQYVRKISGSTKPSKANEAAFARAVDEVTAASKRCWTRSSPRAAARPRGRGGEGPGPRRGSVRVAFRAVLGARPLADRLRPDHRAAGALRVPGKDPLKLWQTILLGSPGRSWGRSCRMFGFINGDERSRTAKQRRRCCSSLAGAIVLLILYRKFVQKRPITGPCSRPRP